jgi:hypothetical protein
MLDAVMNSARTVKGARLKKRRLIETPFLKNFT